ncbi:MAG: hypothetical protein AB1757_21830 [Acidobacteriota bacterium]
MRCTRHGLARRSTIAHLEKLEAEERVQRIKHQYVML